MPFAAPCRWYPSRVQLSRDGLARDKARFSKPTNCRAIGLSSHVRGPLHCKVIVGSTMCRRELAQARKQPPYAAAMPPAAEGTCYPPSIQLIRKTKIGSEARCHKFSNGGEQSKSAVICGPLGRHSPLSPATAARRSLPTLLHWSIMRRLPADVSKSQPRTWRPTATPQLCRRPVGPSCGSPDGCPYKPGSAHLHTPDRLQGLAWHRQRRAERSGLLPGIGR